MFLTSDDLPKATGHISSISTSRMGHKHMLLKFLSWCEAYVLRNAFLPCSHRLTRRGHGLCMNPDHRYKKFWYLRSWSLVALSCAMNLGSINETYYQCCHFEYFWRCTFDLTWWPDLIRPQLEIFRQGMKKVGDSVKSCLKSLHFTYMYSQPKGVSTKLYR